MRYFAWMLNASPGERLTKWQNDDVSLVMKSMAQASSKTASTLIQETGSVSSI